MNNEWVVEENERRRSRLRSAYNPETGEGCCGERFLFSLLDSPVGDLFLPVGMRSLPSVVSLSAFGGIRSMLLSLSTKHAAVDNSEDSFKSAWIAFCELRMRFDFEYFAFMCETIKAKMTGEVVPFVLNKGQRKVLAMLEGQRLSGHPIRLVVLKARQWGSSTLIQMYMLWIQMLLKENWNSVICAHKMDASKNIRAMYNFCIGEMIPLSGVKYYLTPFEGAQNIKQLSFRGCRITVGSSVEPDSVRSQDVKMAHFSEVAYYRTTDNTTPEQLISSITSTVPALPLTMIVYESTANGMGGFFYNEYMNAVAEKSAFVPAFVAWFEIDEYACSFDSGYYGHNGRQRQNAVVVMQNGECRMENLLGFVGEMTDYEVNLFKNNPSVTLEHLNWYRQMKSQTGELMQQEYPSSAIEAFKDSDLTVFKADHVEALRSGCNYRVAAVGVMTAAGDASRAKISGVSLRSLCRDVRFVGDSELLSRVVDCDGALLKPTEAMERLLDSRLVVWRFPDTSITVKRRYIVVYDPQRGLTSKADWGVITVIDRYWRQYGGKSEIVAEFRGHTDKDITVWIAVQIAVYYCSALLVVESNTFDSTFNKEDGTEFIFDTISSCYSNLYSRSEADKVREGVPVRYGFHTNKNTKPAIISDFVSTLRERAYVERSHRALDQARVYERRQDGTYGAKEGYHDDDLITRMIGLYVDYHDLSLPEVVEAASKELGVRVVNESSF